MLKLLRRQAIKTLRNPSRSLLPNPLHNNLYTRHLHILAPPFSGPPSYATIAQRFSTSDTNPISFFRQKAAKEAIENSQFIDIHDVGGVDPKDYDVLLSDVDDNTLHSEISKFVGIPYLIKATRDEADKVAEEIHGFLYNPKNRFIFPCVLSIEDKARWVFFIVDSGAPLTYISTQVAQAFSLDVNEEHWNNAKVAGHSQPVYLSPPNSHFSEVNLLGTDFCSTNRLRTWVEDSPRLVTYYIGKNCWKKPEHMPKLAEVTSVAFEARFVTDIFAGRWSSITTASIPPAAPDLRAQQDCGVTMGTLVRDCYPTLAKPLVPQHRRAGAEVFCKVRKDPTRLSFDYVDRAGAFVKQEQANRDGSRYINITWTDIVERVHARAIIAHDRSDLTRFGGFNRANFISLAPYTTGTMWDYHMREYQVKPSNPSTLQDSGSFSSVSNESSRRSPRFFYRKRTNHYHSAFNYPSPHLTSLLYHRTTTVRPNNQCATALSLFPLPAYPIQFSVRASSSDNRASIIVCNRNPFISFISLSNMSP